MYSFVCLFFMNICLCIICVPCAHGGGEGIGCPELELCMTVSWYMGAGNRIRSSARTRAPNRWAISPVHYFFYSFLVYALLSLCVAVHRYVCLCAGSPVWAHADVCACMYGDLRLILCIFLDYSAPYTLKEFPMEMPTLANESGQPVGSGNSSFLPPWCRGHILQVFHQLSHIPSLCLLNSASHQIGGCRQRVAMFLATARNGIYPNSWQFFSPEMARVECFLCTSCWLSGLSSSQNHQLYFSILNPNFSNFLLQSSFQGLRPRAVYGVMVAAILPFSVLLALLIW